MIRFLVVRLSYGVVVLGLVVLIVSSIIYAAPVDPARMTFGERLDVERAELKRKQLGLDEGLLVQVIGYLRDVSPLYIGTASQWKEEYKGSLLRIGPNAIGFKWPFLRESYQSGRKVSEILAESFPNTLLLASIAIGLALMLGSITGVFAALWKDSWLDKAIILISTLGYSVPSYVTAIVLAILFGYVWKDYFGLNIQGSLYELNDFGDLELRVQNLILPSIALGIRPVSIIAQLMRSAMLKVMGEKFILVARSKGLSKFNLIKKHVLKNAFNPVLTALSGWFASLLAGAFFVEYIFNFKGLGFVTVNALLNYDIPVILGALLLSCTFFIIINILVDVFYRLMDPRISLHV